MTITMNSYYKSNVQKNAFIFLNKIKLIQFRIGFILAITFLLLSNVAFTQTEGNKTSISYKASEEAIKELETLLLNDKAKIEFAMKIGRAHV